MTYTGPIEDRLAIRELVETYNDAVQQRDKERWAATWAENSKWHFMGSIIEGREAIVQTWLGAMNNLPYVNFFAIPGMIAVDGEAAIARVYVREFLVLPDESTKSLHGIYTDTLQKIDGQWKFTERAYKVLKEL